MLGVAGLLVAGAAACGGPAPSAPPAAPLTNTFESPEAMAEALLAALAANDRQRLAGLALTEAEFRDHVWPELPASRPERNVPVEYAWGQMKQRSDGSLSQILSRYGGRPLRFVRASFTGETTVYRTFTVMRQSEVIAADDTGKELVLRLYGSALVKDGRYKIFSYVVDD